MKNLSYTQEFFLCAVNNKGDVPAITEICACFIAGGLMELLSSRYIARNEKNKLVSDKIWNDDLSYLKPLYEVITTCKKPLDIEGVANVYFESKPFEELLSMIGTSLLESGHAERIIKKGLFKEKIKYIPKSDAVKRVVDKIRAELLETGTMTMETICLASMLEKSNLIKNYFSKYESDNLKKRIKELQESEAYALIKGVSDYIDTMLLMIASVGTL